MTHLTDEQVTAWMAGGRTPEQERHVGECPECRAEVAGLESALSMFRGAVRDWSASSRDLPGRRRPQPRWMPIAATLVILILVPVYRNVQRQRAAGQARADALLLEQVQAGLSRPVPAPMEPLLSLVPGGFQ